MAPRGVAEVAKTLPMEETKVVSKRVALVSAWKAQVGVGVESVAKALVLKPQGVGDGID